MNTLLEMIKAPAAVHDAGRAEETFVAFRESVEQDEALSTLAGALTAGSSLENLLLSVFGSSPYLSGLIQRNPENLQEFLVHGPETVLAGWRDALESQLNETDSQKTAMSLLRTYKQQVALCVALADVGQVWSIEQVTQALSDAADVSIASALRFLLNRVGKAGDLEPADENAPENGCGYFILGMGKLGAGELNYSSDVDLIVFYDAAANSLKDGVEPSTFFVRLTRDLVKLLQERTVDGYVWRTDLRLRPDPGATQLALSTDAGLSYYESFGQNWERAALIKARVVAGDSDIGKAFLQDLSPFIWRRYLDYAAIADIHAMKRRVHEFKGHTSIAVAGHDLKLGRGGIREIEFFVQTQQLISGGRQSVLRTKKTLETLGRLVEQGWIEEDVASDLGAAYRFLRKIEHRVQMVADEQTHKLPEKPEELERIAKFSGYDCTETFSQELVAHLQCVQAHYDELFARLPDIGEKDEGTAYRPDDELPETLATLAECGFADPDGVVETIRSWRAGRYASTRSSRSREALSVIQNELLTALSTTDDPDLALASFDRFLSELPAGVQLFSMLRSNPRLLRLLADIMGTAPRLARVLSRRSRILDAVLDPGFFGELLTPEKMRAMIGVELDQCLDYQDCLDRARRIGAEQSFLIGVRVISGTLEAESAGEAYASLAQSLIRSLHSKVEDELVRAHGRIAEGQAAVIAMGKLGGYEMTAASDLDLIIVYDFPEDAGSSDGGRPLSGSQYYARFTQRLISAISAQTAEGSLFEVDMRLRPSGHSGPIATHFQGFADYQHEKAWTWEHMALTRARVMSGPPELVQKIEKVIADVLTSRRENEVITSDVRDMRVRIDQEKGTQDIWDLKHVRGGLVDLEFLAQYIQIISAHDKPGILSQNTLEALGKLEKEGILSQSDAEVLIPACRLYHSLTQILRLCLERPFEEETASPGLKSLLAHAADLPDFESLKDKLGVTITDVKRVYDQIIG